ncbi:hypothetical protein [Olivibacter domesticus]|uniref:Uncharacterized protein n=1 Tax=Olivibacter domesticus TaxID=407022 RepID=A0A1H7R6P6_OLID1|nr:hypothetical protein [Olivibacter domesticus]SEL55920.1 hypothetical protein SAMN05661044_02865 [Olivibacter domesticus]
MQFKVLFHRDSGHLLSKSTFLSRNLKHYEHHCPASFHYGQRRLAQTNNRPSNEAPRIINIVNFIRQTDYWVEHADSLLFETVQQQINQFQCPATFYFGTTPR